MCHLTFEPKGGVRHVQDSYKSDFEYLKNKCIVLKYNQIYVHANLQLLAKQ